MLRPSWVAMLQTLVSWLFGNCDGRTKIERVADDGFAPECPGRVSKKVNHWEYSYGEKLRRAVFTEVR